MNHQEIILINLNQFLKILKEIYPGIDHSFIEKLSKIL